MTSSTYFFPTGRLFPFLASTTSERVNFTIRFFGTTKERCIRMNSPGGRCVIGGMDLNVIVYGFDV